MSKVHWVVVITRDEAEKLYESMEGCCDIIGMDLIREILARFNLEDSSPTRSERQQPHRPE